MNLIKIDNTAALTGAVTAEGVEALRPQAVAAAQTLEAGTGAGSDFTGWLHLPSSITEEQFAAIERSAQLLRNECEYVVAVGIGGSYLGVKAIIEALSDNFAALKPASGARLLFAGNNIGEDYLHDLMGLLQGRKFGIIVISKSGTTTEPAIAFRLLKGMLEREQGREWAARHTIAITDAARGALRTLATAEGYETFVVPDTTGGRFSALTAVGLLPMAAAYQKKKLSVFQRLCVTFGVNALYLVVMSYIASIY